MFYQRFIPLCESKGVKPSHVAKQLGLASGSPTAWKNGTVPDREALVKIADFFDCSVDYLLGRTDDPQSSKVDEDPQTTEAIKLYKALTDENKELVRQMMKGLLKK